VREFLDHLMDDLVGDHIAHHFADARRYWRICPLDVDIGYVLQNPDATVEVWIVDEPPMTAKSVADACQYIRDRFMGRGAQSFTRLDLVSHG